MCNPLEKMDRLKPEEPRRYRVLYVNIKYFLVLKTFVNFLIGNVLLKVIENIPTISTFAIKINITYFWTRNFIEKLPLPYNV